MLNVVVLPTRNDDVWSLYIVMFPEWYAMVPSLNVVIHVSVVAAVALLPLMVTVPQASWLSSMLVAP